jgi:hypothetical protein
MIAGPCKHRTRLLAPPLAARPDQVWVDDVIFLWETRPQAALAVPAFDSTTAGICLTEARNEANQL